MLDEVTVTEDFAFRLFPLPEPVPAILNGIVDAMLVHDRLPDATINHNSVKASFKNSHQIIFMPSPAVLPPGLRSVAEAHPGD